jgi:hypothetical protein
MKSSTNIAQISNTEKKRSFVSNLSKHDTTSPKTQNTYGGYQRFGKR